MVQRLYPKEWLTEQVETPSSPIENLFWDALEKELGHLLLFVLEYTGEDRRINVGKLLPRTAVVSRWWGHIREGHLLDEIYKDFRRRWDGPEDINDFVTIIRAALFASGRSRRKLLLWSFIDTCGTGFFDTGLILEKRRQGMAKAPDADSNSWAWLLGLPIFRTAKNKVIPMGNSHSVLSYGPLRFEVGVSTEQDSSGGRMCVPGLSLMRTHPPTSLLIRNAEWMGFSLLLDRHPSYSITPMFASRRRSAS
jgi:hypothetical protein